MAAASNHAHESLDSAVFASTQKAITFTDHIFIRIRLATEHDVPHLFKLMHHIAHYHDADSLCNVTEDSIANNLFKSNILRPFYSVTALVLEVSPTPYPDDTPNPWFTPITRKLNLDYDVFDKESEEFRTHGDEVFVAGYIMFCPLYTALFSKPGLYCDSMYFRECFRGLGFGLMLASTILHYAAKNEMAMVDGIVADWNSSPIGLYTKMGGSVINEFRLCRFYGAGLAKYKDGPVFPKDSSPQ